MENKGFDDDGNQASNAAPLPEKQATDVTLEVSRDDKGRPDKPYSGMGKEDVLRFSDTPFWNNLRLGIFIAFWVCWAALLATVLGLTITAPRCEAPPEVQWWQSAPFYQLYVRSFYDSDGDGVGDIRGVIEKMQHFVDLNVQGIIISSFYQSHYQGQDANNPNPDFGYEVTDHKAVDPAYGTMADVQDLIAAAHDNDMKIVLEFIPNHTGTQHPWFIGSSAVDPNYAGYYVWSTCSPNNWKSIYNDGTGAGQTAWTAGARTGECYLHQGLPSQPDLNLRSTRVQEELEDILRFWLDAGVDGFRVNGARYLFEDYDLRDQPLLHPLPANCTGAADDPYECYEHVYTASQQENFALIARWRAIIEDYNTENHTLSLLITDAKESVANSLLYYGNNGQDGANLALNYDLLSQVQAGCDGICMDQLVSDWLEGKDADVTTDWMTSHHDEPRLDPAYSEALTVLKFTLPGSSILHYGEEIGMVNGDVSSSCVDPAGYAGGYCRDRSRTPMQWDDSAGAGFGSNSTTWLPVNSDYTTVNVQTLWDSSDENNVLQMFSKMADLQRTSTAFNYGELETVIVNDDIYSFLRHYDGTDRYLVTMNLGSNPATENYASHSMVPGNADMVASNAITGDTVNLKDLTLDPGDYVVAMWPYDR